MYVTSVPVGNPNFMIAFVPRGIEKYRPPIIYILVFWIWLSNGYCSKYGWLDTSVHSTVGKIPSGFLRIVQFVLGKQDEYVSPIVPHFFSIVCFAYDTIFSVFRKNIWRCESYCLLLCTVLCNLLANKCRIFFFRCTIRHYLNYYRYNLAHKVQTFILYYASFFLSKC